MQKSPEEIAFVSRYASPMALPAFVTRFLGVPAGADAPAASDGAQSPAALTSTDAAVLLQRLDTERARTEAEIENLTTGRRAALLTGADDEVILGMDRRLDALHLRSERLDVAEPALLDAVADAQLSEEREDVAELRDACSATVGAMCAALGMAADLRGKLLRLRRHIVGAELERHFTAFEMAPLAFPLDREAIGRFEAATQAALRDLRTTALKPPVFAITFARRTGPYNRGETAGFDAATAHHYVDTGEARWADGVRIPPKPAKAAPPAKPAPRAWPRHVMPDEAPVQSRAPGEHEDDAAAEVNLESYAAPLIAADLEASENVEPPAKRRTKQPTPNAGDAA